MILFDSERLIVNDIVNSGGKIVMTKYEELEMEVISFTEEDIITTSGGDEDEGEIVIP